MKNKIYGVLLLIAAVLIPLLYMAIMITIIILTFLLSEKLYIVLRHAII